MQSEERKLLRVATERAARPPGGRLEPADMERDENRLAIVWKDGHRSTYSFDELRRACPCATCRTERESAAAAGGLRVVSSNAPVHAALSDVQWVGWYAFRFGWEDGHDTGIYSFEYLRALCPCPECSVGST